MAAFGSQPYRTRRAISAGSTLAQSGLGRAASAPAAGSPAYRALSGAPPPLAASSYDVSGRKVPDYVQQPGSGVYFGSTPGSEFIQKPGGQGSFAAWNTNSPGGSMGYLGVSGALNPPAPIKNYYTTLLGNRLRAIESLAGAQRYAGQGILESRGMGSSSEVGRLNADIAGKEQLAGQEAAAGVQALQYAQFEGAMNFERQAYLARLSADVAQDRTPWYAKAIPIVGDVIGQYLGSQTPSGGNGSGQGFGGYMQSWQ